MQREKNIATGKACNIKVIHVLAIDDVAQLPYMLTRQQAHQRVHPDQMLLGPCQPAPGSDAAPSVCLPRQMHDVRQGISSTHSVCGETLHASGRLENSPRSFFSDPLPELLLPLFPPPALLLEAPTWAPFVAAAPLLSADECCLKPAAPVLAPLPLPLAVSKLLVTPLSACEPTCAAFVAAAPLAECASGWCLLRRLPPPPSSSARDWW